MEKKRGSNTVLIAVAVIVLILLCPIMPVNAKTPYPDNLWQGFIAEETNGTYELYYAMACATRNRIQRGRDTGIVALRRKDLNEFVRANIRYMIQTKNIDIAQLSQRAILNVFEKDSKDITQGATLHEDIDIYGFPKSWDKDKVIPTIKIGTRQFYREK